ncbi:MAG: HesB/IscA family protein [Myxococcota bacterium]
MIQLTAAAAAQIRGALASKGIDGYGLRVQVVGGGCEGFLYDLLYSDFPDPEDQVFESHGVRLFVDPKALRVVGGLTIDHAKTPHGTGFIFTHPSAKRRCECGASFSI